MSIPITAKFPHSALESLPLTANPHNTDLLFSVTIDERVFSWILYRQNHTVNIPLFFFLNINVWLPLARPLLGTWPTTQACALTGNQTCDPMVCRPALNPLSHTSQGSFCLAYFAQCNYFEICTCCMLMDIWIVSYHDITHKAIMNIRAQVFMWTYVFIFLRWVLRSRMAELYGGCVFK